MSFRNRYAVEPQTNEIDMVQSSFFRFDCESEVNTSDSSSAYNIMGDPPFY